MQHLNADQHAWSAFHTRWARLRPPQRPDASVCAAVAELLGTHRRRTLLLGATPELAGVGDLTVAVDWSHTMLRWIWPGFSAGRRAAEANWLQLPCADDAFSAVIGDGSLNCLEYPAGYIRLFHEIARVLQPGGRVALRVYLTPEPCESIEAARRRMLAGDVADVHVLKWQLANALSAERADPNVPVQAIASAFNRVCPDRRYLRRAAGWTDEDFGQVDAYQGLSVVYSFPTAAQLARVIPDSFRNARLVATGSYQLAERCPLLAMDLAA